jgi:hypothetical protein
MEDTPGCHTPGKFQPYFTIFRSFFEVRLEPRDGPIELGVGKK